MRRTLKKNTSPFNFVFWKYRKAGLCGQLFLDFVEIPPDTTKIDVVFYEYPGKNRMKVTLPDLKYDNVIIDGESVMLYCSADDFLFRHFKKN